MISGNFYLSQSQMEENATETWPLLRDLGWSFQSIAGMFGNFQSESTMNPGIWESLDEGNLNGGFGLAQWTPASKYIDWCTAEAIEPSDMNSAVARLEWELANKQQWYPTTQYPLTFAQFKVSTLDPYTLAMMFIKNYERPRDPNQPNRGTQAQYWYKFITGDSPNPPIPPHPGRVYTSMPIYYYMKRR